MKQKIEIKVYEYDECFGGANSPPTGLCAFQKWIAEKAREIPNEYLDSASIEIDSGIDYEVPKVTIKISYSRLETDEEEIRRETAVRQREEAKRREELELLARLQAKYGGGA